MHSTLMIQDNSKGIVVGDYRPIDCISLMWKLSTSIFSEAMYGHLSCQELLPNEEKGCRKNSRRTKDQLLIDKFILKNCQRRLTNLSMSWIDYRKRFIAKHMTWCPIHGFWMIVQEWLEWPTISP